jgi:mono/diheme cytochrome c family protein
MKKLIVLIVATFLAAGASAKAAEAKENYEKHCAKCHGVEGKGDTKMGKKLEVIDYTDPKVQEKMKDEDMLKTIKEGKKDGDKVRMKAYADALTEPEIKALVAYVRAFKK